MKIAIDKKRFSFVLTGVIVLVALIAVLVYSLTRSTTKTVYIKLHAMPAKHVAMNTITPTATPTAVLKFYPTKGVIK